MDKFIDGATWDFPEEDVIGFSLYLNEKYKNKIEIIPHPFCNWRLFIRQKVKINIREQYDNFKRTTDPNYKRFIFVEDPNSNVGLIDWM